MVLTRLNILIIFGFLLRIFVSIWNGFWGPSFGADADAMGFHLNASAYSINLIFDQFVMGHLYSFFLGVVYYITTDSLFIGSFLSSLVWLASAFVLVWIFDLLSFEKSSKMKAIFFYSIIPSSIFLTSITLREVYQLFFVNLAFFSILKIYMKNSQKYWLTLILSILIMGVLHGALFVFGIYLFITTIVIINIQKSWPVILIKGLFIAPFLLLIIINGLLLFQDIGYKLDDGIIMAVQAYQLGGLGVDARAFYKNSIEINGLSDFIIFVPIGLFQYLFEPMPWRISSLADIPLLFENILRMWLIWRAVVILKNKNTNDRRPLIFIFLSFILIESIWSLGTINWGTAARHHIPSLGLLLISAYALSDRRVLGDSDRKFLT